MDPEATAQNVYDLISEKRFKIFTPLEKGNSPIPRKQSKTLQWHGTAEHTRYATSLLDVEEIVAVKAQVFKLVDKVKWHSSKKVDVSSFQGVQGGKKACRPEEDVAFPDNHFSYSEAVAKVPPHEGQLFINRKVGIRKHGKPAMAQPYSIEPVIRTYSSSTLRFSATVNEESGGNGARPPNDQNNLFLPSQPMTSQAPISKKVVSNSGKAKKANSKPWIRADRLRYDDSAAKDETKGGRCKECGKWKPKWEPKLSRNPFVKPQNMIDDPKGSLEYDEGLCQGHLEPKDDEKPILKTFGKEQSFSETDMNIDHLAGVKKGG